jgi:hypothetical protein
MFVLALTLLKFTEIFIKIFFCRKTTYFNEIGKKQNEKINSRRITRPKIYFILIIGPKQVFVLILTKITSLNRNGCQGNQNKKPGNPSKNPGYPNKKKNRKF